MIVDFDWNGECRLRHRGPDWSGIHCHQDCYLAHQRLAIVDPTSGDQPLYNEDKTVIVTVYFLFFFQIYLVYLLNVGSNEGNVIVSGIWDIGDGDL